MENDILDDIGISDTGPSHESEAKKKQKSDDKVNMYEVETVKAKDIDTDSFEKSGHTFMVHVFDGDNDITETEEQIIKVATKLKDKGYVLRCESPSDDKIPNKIAKIDGMKVEAYLPFKKFNPDLADKATLTNKYELPYQYAAQLYGQRYNDLTPGVRAIFAAKIMAALGIDSDNPVDFLICYSPDGREYMPDRNSKEKIDYAKLGSLSFYLKMAQKCGIPVYNFKNKDSLINFVNNYLKNNTED